MACSNSSRKILSHPEFILNYFDHLPRDDSDSDGYSEDEDFPTDHSNSLPNQSSASSFTSVIRTNNNMMTVIIT